MEDFLGMLGEVIGVITAIVLFIPIVFGGLK